MTVLHKLANFKQPRISFYFKPNWFPIVALTMALGLLTVADSFARARLGQPHSQTFYWVGVLMIYTPTVIRVCWPQVKRGESLLLLTLLGLSLFYLKVLHHPLQPMFHDEFLHWRTVNDILLHEQLFSLNPSLRVSPIFPGMNTLVAMVVWLTGLSVFVASHLVLGAARIVFIVSLFLFYEHIGKSTRLAGVAILAFMTNPNFVYWSSQFGYESMALPLAVSLLMVASQRASRQHPIYSISAILYLNLLAILFTHHLTTMATITYLFSWTLVFFVSVWLVKLVLFFRHKFGSRPLLAKLIQFLLGDEPLTPAEDQRRTMGSVWLAGFAGIFFMTWVVHVATPLLDYSGPYVVRLMETLSDLLEGNFVTRELYVTGSGSTIPKIEQQISLFSTITTVLILPLGLLKILKQYRTNILAVVLGVGAVGYVASLFARFIPEIGVELSARASPFLYVAVAFVFAFGLAMGLLPQRAKDIRWLIVIGLFPVLFTGGIMLGWYPTERLPGPYQVVSQGRSIEREGVATAYWMRDHLGSDNRIATDRINRLLVSSYGQQHAVTNWEWWIPPIFTSAHLADDELTSILEGDIAFLVVDLRLSLDTPTLGFYFNEVEESAYNHEIPIDVTSLTKFEGVTGLNRVYHAGNLSIYQVVDSRLETLISEAED